MGVNINIEFHIFYLHIDTQNQQNSQGSAYNSHLPKNNIYTLLEVSFKKFPRSARSIPIAKYSNIKIISEFFAYFHIYCSLFPHTKKGPEASNANPMLRLLLSLNLRPNFPKNRNALLIMRSTPYVQIVQHMARQPTD